MDRRPIQLELPLPKPADKTWADVDSLNERTLMAERRRRKLVKPKMRQQSILPSDQLSEPAVG